ncbi:MAG: tetratricopeptide repeat protein [Candidatus Margulisbacteria bacterium]|nr:tetratricopeptide repeat protein [Candidatus Margulisiibacteriota bacterium]
MKKITILVFLLILVSAAMAMADDRSIIDREDLSLKAGPTEPGEGVSLVWLECYVYPKTVKSERVISLGVRTTARVSAVSASFDSGPANIVLTSNDGLAWSGALKLPDNISSGIHIARYLIKGENKATIRRTIDFFVAEAAPESLSGPRISKGEAIYSQSWPLTIATTCSALVGASSRILYAGEKVIGVSQVPWYKVILEDGEEGWVPSAAVKEPVDEYYLLGYEAYNNKKYSEAIDYYKNTIAIRPDYVKGHLWLAKSYFQQGELESAYRKIKEAIRLDERDIDCKVFANTLARRYFAIARDKLNARRYNEAIAAYQNVLDLKPSSTASWIEMAQSYEKLGMPQEARSACREALRLEPENREVLAFLKIEPGTAVLAKADEQAIKEPVKIAARPSAGIPPALADDSLNAVKEAKTGKGTRIEAAIKSVIALTKSLGTPVIEKGWQARKQGDKFLVRYLCDQGSGALEAFEWLVDIDTKQVSASNANSKLLMDRW